MCYLFLLKTYVKPETYVFTIKLLYMFRFFNLTKKVKKFEFSVRAYSGNLINDNSTGY